MSMEVINIAMVIKFKVASIRHFVLRLRSVYTFSTLALSIFVCLSETGRSLALARRLASHSSLLLSPPTQTDWQ